jgi:peptidoglycan-associated lipoprotein
MRSLALSTLLLCSALAAGCGGDDKPPPAAPTGGTQGPSAAATPESGDQKPGDDPARSQLNISDEIKKACGITDAEAFFAFDSSNVRPQDRQVLRKLAECFSTGALAGREMRLVGHADPRGEPEYNMVLGGKRADNVKRVIAAEGLTGDKISTTSRGEMDATGTDEASWSRDRRVDVVLGD